jgi:hypothetical protein
MIPGLIVALAKPPDLSLYIHFQPNTDTQITVIPKIQSNQPLAFFDLNQNGKEVCITSFFERWMGQDKRPEISTKRIKRLSSSSDLHHTILSDKTADEPNCL